MVLSSTGYQTHLHFGIDQWYMSVKARLFQNGRSQAVRLPAEFRFSGEEVYIRRDPASGDVILSARPHSWKDFLKLLDSSPDPDAEEFLRNRIDPPPQKRELF